MKNTLLQILDELYEVIPSAKKAFGYANESPSIVAEPIDTGSVTLLAGHANAYLDYSPLDCEYLMRTLNEQILNCLELRLRAQELEIRAFNEANDQLLEARLLPILKEQAVLEKNVKPDLLGNTIAAKIVGDSIEGDTSNYWSEISRLQSDQLALRGRVIVDRLTRLSEPGNGSNFVERFKSIQDLYRLDFVEAYNRARSASIGLRDIYGIKNMIPPLTEIGYLDALSRWSKETTFSLERKLSKRRECDISFSLHSGEDNDVPTIMTFKEFSNGRNNGSFSFFLPDNFFVRKYLKLKNPRIRGIDVYAWKYGQEKEKDISIPIWRVKVIGPRQEFEVDHEGRKYQYIPCTFAQASIYPRFAQEAITVPSNREFHNINPCGEWVLEVEPNGVIRVKDDYYFDDLVVRLRVAYDRE